MADLIAGPPAARPPDRPGAPALGEQLRLVAWLRWRSLRNGLHNKNRRLDLLGVFFSGLFSSVLVVGITVALFIVTRFIFTEHQEKYLGLIFLALLVWWQALPILLAGFAPQFSFNSLLRFPLEFSAFYLVGLAYGLADAAAVAALIWMGAMIAGTLASRPDLAPAMLLACALFAGLNLTLERFLGALLEKLLSKRRSRETLFGIFILSMVSLQFLNPLLQKHGDQVKAVVQAALPYLWLLPSSMAGNFVARTSEGLWREGLLHLTGLLVYLAISSALLWRRYAHLYAGEELSEASAPAAKTTRAAGDLDLTDSLGFLPPQTGAVFRKEVRYLKRNSFLFFSLVIPPVMVFFLTMQIAGSHSGLLRKGISPDVLFPGMMAYLVLIVIAPSYNSFAHESRGIQSYFMCPVRFREILLGKNLMTLVVVFVELVLCIFLVGFRVGFPPAPLLLAILIGTIFSVAGQLTIANWSSIRFPKKMDFGKMQGQRNSGMSVLLMFGVQLVLGGISALVLVSGRWTDSPWLPVQLFAVLAAAAIGGYFASLDALSGLAEAKKELLIETLCR